MLFKHKGMGMHSTFGFAWTWIQETSCNKIFGRFAMLLMLAIASKTSAVCCILCYAYPTKCAQIVLFLFSYLEFGLITPNDWMKVCIFWGIQKDVWCWARFGLFTTYAWWWGYMVCHAELGFANKVLPRVCNVLKVWNLLLTCPGFKVCPLLWGFCQNFKLELWWMQNVCRCIGCTNVWWAPSERALLSEFIKGNLICL